VNIAVTHDKGAKVDCAAGSNVIAVLKPGEAKTCTATGTAVAGLYTNVGTASGTPNPPLLPGQPPVPTPPITASDPATYTGSPSVAVEPPTPQLPGATLPATGSGTGWVAALAAALVVLGAALVVLATSRRRRRIVG
jgi:LPXTG-motif cell wall-anchored protein